MSLQERVGDSRSEQKTGSEQKCAANSKSGQEIEGDRGSEQECI